MPRKKSDDRFEEAFRIKPGKSPRITKRDAGETLGLGDVGAADAQQAANVQRIADLQKVLYADGRFAVLIILQGMDASGKDSTTRHLLTGVNPQGVRVTSFKAPTALELSHDYLWRIHNVCPARGEIAVFNRSHYEDVLVVRVHDLVPKKEWSARYRQINQFERHLAENRTIILKFFLHISRKEQAERLRERLEDPRKNWKMNLKDLDERERWPAYMKAYEHALTECSTDDAPWYVIPSDKKWMRNLAISQIVVNALEGLDLRYPRPTFDPRRVRVE